MSTRITLRLPDALYARLQATAEKADEPVATSTIAILCGHYGLQVDRPQGLAALDSGELQRVTRLGAAASAKVRKPAKTAAEKKSKK